MNAPREIQIGEDTIHVGDARASHALLGVLAALVTTLFLVGAVSGLVFALSGGGGASEWWMRLIMLVAYLALGVLTTKSGWELVDGNPHFPG